MLLSSSVRTTSPESKWHSELLWKILVCDRLSLSGTAEAGESHPAGTLDRLKQTRPSIWKDFSFDLTQVCEWLRSSSCTCTLTAKSLETGVHKILLCSFGHGTFTPITFYMIQRNLIQPCFKGRFLAFFYVFKKMRIFKAHLSSTYDRALMLLWCVELARPGWMCPTCQRKVSAATADWAVDHARWMFSGNRSPFLS